MVRLTLLPSVDVVLTKSPMTPAEMPLAVLPAVSDRWPIVFPETAAAPVCEAIPRMRDDAEVELLPIGPVAVPTMLFASVWTTAPAWARMP